MAVTGASGPTSQAGDFALITGISSVQTIGYYSAGPNYAVNFPQVNGILSTTNMRMGINLASGTNPSYNLQINGNAAKNDGSSFWTVASDMRLKKDISKYTDGLNIIRQINPIWFRYNGKGGLSESELQVGVAAQEMKKIAPYTVKSFMAKYDPSSPGEQEFYNFDYNALGYALINAVKELDSRVIALEKENALLKQQLQDSVQRAENDTSQQLKAELDNQKSRTDQLEAQLAEIKRLLNIEAKAAEK
jgi:trimeric autotransporter adhesin